ncbi:MAG: serine--tRNA ligase [Planctomycetota bacterium]|jgi:seryl-tRNA synthetase
MIDLKALRTDPERFKRGAREKGIAVDIERLLKLDEQRRGLLADQETKRAEQKRLSKEIGPQIGKFRRQLKDADAARRDALEADIRLLEERPVTLKAEIQAFESKLAEIEPEWKALWLGQTLGLVSFERGVQMAGTRHYVLTGDGAALHQAVLRFAMDLITKEHGFVPVSIPVIVREELMLGTGFFPSGRDQAYLIEESSRGGGHDLYLTGTGEVGLMGLHADEILSADALPMKYATVSTCFRREAGAAGKDTAGLYRIHQFDKVEQVVICRADEAESRRWHETMIGIVEQLLQQLQLPYRLLQCCTADLGPKNADMIDLECWMPSRGPEDEHGVPRGAYGETHSASRLYDFQCRRLNLRYRGEDSKTVFCHSLNNTVAASPRLLIPILELYQNEDGTVTVPEPLIPYMHGKRAIGSG